MELYRHSINENQFSKNALIGEFCYRGIAVNAWTIKQKQFLDLVHLADTLLAEMKF